MTCKEVSLTDAAHRAGIRYHTARDYWLAGELRGRREPNGRIVIESESLQRFIEARRARQAFATAPAAA